MEIRVKSFRHSKTVEVNNRWRHQTYYTSFHRHEEMKRSCEPNAQGILVGNQCHLSHLREVQTEDGKQLATHLQLPFYETSTTEDINIKECFDELVDSLLKEIERTKQIRELTTLVLPASGQEARSTDACSCMLL